MWLSDAIIGNKCAHIDVMVTLYYNCMYTLYYFPADERRTVVLVAHQLSTVINADQIIVINEVQSKELRH